MDLAAEAVHNMAIKMVRISWTEAHRGLTGSELRKWRRFDGGACVVRLSRQWDFRLRSFTEVRWCSVWAQSWWRMPGSRGSSTRWLDPADGGGEKWKSGDVTANQGVGVSREVRQVLVPLPEGRLEKEFTLIRLHRPWQSGR